jgi:hypothetical protein
MNSNVPMTQENKPSKLLNNRLSSQVYRWSNAIPKAPKPHHSPVRTPPISTQLTAISGRTSYCSEPIPSKTGTVNGEKLRNVSASSLLQLNATRTGQSDTAALQSVKDSAPYNDVIRFCWLTRLRFR